MLLKAWKRLTSFMKRFPAIIAVTVFVVASMWCNFEFGMRFGIFIAIAMASADFLKGYLYVRCSEAWSSGSYVFWMCALVAGLVLSTFSLTSAIGSIGTMRQEQSSSQSKTNASFTENKVEVERLRKELSQLPNSADLMARSEAILDQESTIKKGTKVRDHVNNCDGTAKPGPHVQKYCGAILELREQASKAEERRNILEKDLKQASTVVQTVGGTTVTDTQASLLLQIFPTLKDIETSSLVLVLFAAVVIELVSSLGWWFVQPRKTASRSRETALAKPSQTSWWSRIIKREQKAQKKPAVPRKRKQPAPLVRRNVPVLAVRDGALTEEFLDLRVLAQNDNDPNSPTPSPKAAMA